VLARMKAMEGGAAPAAAQVKPVAATSYAPAPAASKSSSQSEDAASVLARMNAMGGSSPSTPPASYTPAAAPSPVSSGMSAEEEMAKYRAMAAAASASAPAPAVSKPAAAPAAAAPKAASQSEDAASVLARMKAMGGSSPSAPTARKTSEQQRLSADTYTSGSLSNRIMGGGSPRPGSPARAASPSKEDLENVKRALKAAEEDVEFARAVQDKLVEMSIKMSGQGKVNKEDVAYFIKSGMVSRAEAVAAVRADRRMGAAPAPAKVKPAPAPAPAATKTLSQNEDAASVLARMKAMGGGAAPAAPSAPYTPASAPAPAARVASPVSSPPGVEDASSVLARMKAMESGAVPLPTSSRASPMPAATQVAPKKVEDKKLMGDMDKWLLEQEELAKETDVRKRAAKLKQIKADRELAKKQAEEWRMGRAANIGVAVLESLAAISCVGLATKEHFQPLIKGALENFF